MLNELLLLSGNDIPYVGARVSIHQPTIKEIAYIGEENFYLGCEVLKISKQKLMDVDKSSLENISNFEILMSIMNEKNNVSLKQSACALLVLSLLFQKYELDIDKEGQFIKLTENLDEENIEYFINKNNFSEFQSIVAEMFCSTATEKEEYNPANKTAAAIAEKLKKGRNKAIQAKGQQKDSKKMNILSRYLSILTVGLQKDYNSLLQYTVFQLYEEFKRFNLKYNYDLIFKMQIAGAKDLPEKEDWMEDLHS